MVRSFVISSLLFFLVLGNITSQESGYWILFNQKPDTGFNPKEYLSDKAIKRRTRLGLPVFDYADLPLSEEYISGIEKMGFSVHGRSRWLNGIYVDGPEKEIPRVNMLSYVAEVITVYPKIRVWSNIYSDNEKLTSDKSLASMQLESMEGSLFKDRNIDGTGVRVAVFDVGFSGVDRNPAFSHLFQDNRIIATWDFVKDKPFVYDYGDHGTKVLSCIAGRDGDIQTGLATGAEFLLARTEVKAEKFVEEKNWFLAMEWAERNGADIINSSLGYTYHRYFPHEMNGDKVLVSRAADIAASKGMLVINAMGNDGDSPWKFMGAPADADSVLSVGGIDPETGLHISFSSFGPTADQRRKPNVSAFGLALTANTKSGFARSYGTSFSTPLITGFAACVMQLYPNSGNMDVFRMIEKSGSLYPYYDYAHGYGVPRASVVLKDEKAMTIPLFEIMQEGDSLKIIVNGPLEAEQNYLYYHIENRNKGILKKYGVIRVYSKEPFGLKMDEISNDHVLRVFYKGNTLTYPGENKFY